MNNSFKFSLLFLSVVSLAPFISSCTNQVENGASEPIAESKPFYLNRQIKPVTAEVPLADRANDFSDHTAMNSGQFSIGYKNLYDLVIRKPMPKGNSPDGYWFMMVKGKDAKVTPGSSWVEIARNKKSTYVESFGKSFDLASFKSPAHIFLEDSKLADEAIVFATLIHLPASKKEKPEIIWTADSNQLTELSEYTLQAKNFLTFRDSSKAEPSQGYAIGGFAPSQQFFSATYFPEQDRLLGNLRAGTEISASSVAKLFDNLKAEGLLDPSIKYDSEAMKKDTESYYFMPAANYRFQAYRIDKEVFDTFKSQSGFTYPNLPHYVSENVYSKKQTQEMLLKAKKLKKGELASYPDFQF